VILIELIRHMIAHDFRLWLEGPEGTQLGIDAPDEALMPEVYQALTTYKARLLTDFAPFPYWVKRTVDIWPHPATRPEYPGTPTSYQVSYQRLSVDYEIADGTYTPKDLRQARLKLKAWGPVQTYSLTWPPTTRKGKEAEVEVGDAVMATKPSIAVKYLPDVLGEPCPICESKEKWIWLDGSLLCRAGVLRGEHQ
jgi:hypothetical protein